MSPRTRAASSTPSTRLGPSSAAVHRNGHSRHPRAAPTQTNLITFDRWPFRSDSLRDPRRGMVHRPCAAPGLGIDAAACPGTGSRTTPVILSKSPLFEAPCNSPPIECLSSFLFPIISRTAPSGLDRGPIFLFYFPGIRRYAWLVLANFPRCGLG